MTTDQQFLKGGILETVMKLYLQVIISAVQVSSLRQNNTGLKNRSQFVRESEAALIDIMPRGNLLT